MDPLQIPRLSLYVLGTLGSAARETLGELGITSVAELLAYPPFRHARALRAAEAGLLGREAVAGHVGPAWQGKPLEALLGAPCAVLAGVDARQAATLARLGLSRVADLAAFAALDEAEALVAGGSRAGGGGAGVQRYTSFFRARALRDSSVLCQTPARIGQLFNFDGAQPGAAALGYAVTYRQQWVQLGVRLGSVTGTAPATQAGRPLSAAGHAGGAPGEVARATALQHQCGATSALAATAATAGCFVGTTGGAGPLVAADTVVFGGVALGYVEADVEADREAFAASALNLQQRTVHNASLFRPGSDQAVQPLPGALCFEVLNDYRVSIAAQDFTPLLFLPFKPLHFSAELLGEYWWLIRPAVADRALVRRLDARDLRLRPDAGLGAWPAMPAAPEDAEAGRVSVTVRLSGATAEQAIRQRACVTPALGSDDDGSGVTAAVGLFWQLFDEEKRRRVTAALLTTQGPVEMVCESVDGERDVSWTFATDRAVRVADITGVRVANGNGELKLGGVALGTLGFDEVWARLQVRDADAYAAPVVALLEEEQRLCRGCVVGAHGQKDLAWLPAAHLEGQTGRRAAAGMDGAEAEATLLGFLNANPYTFTPRILQGLEPGALEGALEGVHIGDIALADVAVTTPVGFCAGHVLLPMKACKAATGRYGKIGVDTLRLEMMLAQFERAAHDKPAEAGAARAALHDYLKQFLQIGAGSGNGSVREVRLLGHVRALSDLLEQLSRLAAAGGAGLADARLTAATGRLLDFLHTPVRSSGKDAAQLCGHFDALKAKLGRRMGQCLGSDEVSLPSGGVYAGGAPAAGDA
ncbi:hypothetical protein [Crenobacter caeni]|uniref:Uncharacterized protein n=1 Tax=Crenobacter caeni TaxID=2705474 RepID=A0A6B2KQ83_9NEIS|nr:hypothetical protein [Crenobacter caeni]NDV12300.1 hypothetical protein [Crenobacter caeni]